MIRWKKESTNLKIDQSRISSLRKKNEENRIYLQLQRSVGHHQAYQYTIITVTEKEQKGEERIFEELLDPQLPKCEEKH